MKSTVNKSNATKITSLLGVLGQYQTQQLEASTFSLDSRTCVPYVAQYPYCPNDKDRKCVTDICTKCGW